MTWLQHRWDAEGNYLCPNCLTPWKCNGPHYADPYDTEAHVAVAFAAIRRAAEVARSIDANREEHRKANNWIDFVHCEWRAYSVRRAIRAAIGSDKT